MNSPGHVLPVPPPPPPSVAILIPNRNYGAFIEATLLSALAQTHPNTSIHVLDDGSTDDSVAVIDRVLNQHGNARCHFSTRPNRGLVPTFNELVRSSTTEYVAILGSDDLFLPTRIERMLAPARPGEPFLAFSAVEIFGDDGITDLALWRDWHRQLLHQSAWLPTPGFALLRANLAITSSNLFFSRDLFDHLDGFDPSLPMSEEWDFSIRALRWTEPVFVPELLLRYRIHSNNTYRRHQDARRELTRRILTRFANEAHLPSLNPTAPVPARWPRFFPLFCRSCSGPLGEPLGNTFPPELSRPGHSRTADAVPLEVEQAATRHLLAQVLRNSQADPSDSIANQALNCSSHWSASSPLFRPPPVAPTPTRWTWAGASMAIHPGTPAISDWLTRFTGLAPEPAAPDEAPLIRLLGGNEAIVGLHDRQSFETYEALLAWLALTVSDELGRRSESVLLHSASFLVDGVATLVCGQPFSGKSTTALLALNAGLHLLGDDIVHLHTQPGTVQACPRPLKLRRLPSSLDLLPRQALLDQCLPATLDDEPSWLIPRQEAGMAPVGPVWPVGRIFHLTRSDAPGFDLQRLAAVDALPALAAQVRCHAGPSDPRIHAALLPLSHLPNFLLRVGPAAITDAFEQILR